ncbi:ComEA family DNA-binding protein [Curtobacterium flaccumfaciens pv. beticola]|uniref:ComEA family DNA-binding protein n=1 Tax=Curtobacterium flaccumfaciens TaxID=2035 RepID=UPI0025876393|nr:ComEA family DNA-binding protein [uncultured Curtobacterium sp.]MCS5488689.1 ComEA family DNA-binding protein [Curtobacterium flaccumfaciens pv. basellae]
MAPADPVPDARWRRWTLTPRTAVVLGAVVVAVALAIVGVGAVGERSTGQVTVSGGPAGSGAGAGPASGAASGETDGRTGGSGAPRSLDARPTGGPTPSSTAALVSVYVVGAVARAGVVELPDGSRVQAAIERAGGATDVADLTRVNLARPVVDGERLYVPAVGETEVPAALGPDVAGGAGGGAGAGAGGGSAAGAGGAGDVVDLNRADQATLETLPGIGPALAARIIAWRDEHGGFTTVEDLLDVSGIGDTRFAELRERVRV